MNWNNSNNRRVNSGQITVEEEFANNLAHARISGGSARGGNAILRASILDTMFEGDSNFRSGVANNPVNSRHFSNIDINSYLNNGQVRSRSVSIESMSRDQLLS